MNRLRILAALAAWWIAASLTSCSLLKFSIASNDEPLSAAQTRTRAMTRGFYYDFSNEVARAADSIVATTPDIHTKLAAIRWKIAATRAASSAALQTQPEAALADMWILCRRMERRLAEPSDSLLFGPQTPLAREAAQRLAQRIGKLAHGVLPDDRYELMQGFVDRYLDEKLPDGTGPAAADTSLAWTEYLREHGIETDFATGTVAEVLADASDKASGHTRQLANSIGWTKEMIELQLQQDSLQTQLGAQLDSLERGFGRLVTVAEHLPEISDHMLDEVRTQATQLIHTLNSSVDNAFLQFDRQRSALEYYISAERQSVIDQLHQAAEQTVQQALDAIPGMIGRIVFYVVAGLIVLLGLPFLAGFWLGGLRQKLRAARKKEDEAQR